MIRQMMVVTLAWSMLYTTAVAQKPENTLPEPKLPAAGPESLPRLRVMLLLKGNPRDMAFSIKPGSAVHSPIQVKRAVHDLQGTRYVTETVMKAHPSSEVTIMVDPTRIASLYCDNIQITSIEDPESDPLFDLKSTGPATLVIGNLTLQGDNFSCQNGVLKCENARTTSNPGELKMTAESITLQLPIQQAISESWNKEIPPATLFQHATPPPPSDSFQNAQAPLTPYYPGAPIDPPKNGSFPARN